MWELCACASIDPGCLDWVKIQERSTIKTYLTTSRNHNRYQFNETENGANSCILHGLELIAIANFYLFDLESPQMRLEDHEVKMWGGIQFCN